MKSRLLALAWLALPALAALLAGLGLRGAIRRPRLAAGVAILAGLVCLDAARLAHWPRSYAERLPVGALLMLARPWLGERLGIAGLPLLSLAIAWWLTGAVPSGPALAQAVPVALLLWAGLGVSSWRVRGDGGLRMPLAALALAAAYAVVAAGPHWAIAALVVAAAGAALLGQAEAAPAVAAGVVLVAIDAGLAANSGRYIPVDLAAAAPFAVWLVPGFRLGQTRPRQNRGKAATKRPAARRPRS